MVYKIKDKSESALAKENYSNAWFIVSVFVTVFLITLLAWNLVHSYSTVKSFESRELALENASGDLLFHTKSLEMSARMAAATGDLRWQEVYNEHQPEVDNTLQKIPTLIDKEEAVKETENIQNHLRDISKIEDQVFNLISHGEKDRAALLLSSWDYTKSQLDLTASMENLVGFMHTHVRETVAFEDRLTSILLVILFICLAILVVSWYVSIKIWRMNLQKRQEKEDEITYLSYHDSLTGLYNRRYFEEEVTRLNVQRQLPLTIILGDVNDLKKTNDSLGHKKGDELLIEISEILKNAVREEDIVSRWGGDEFGILLPNTDFEEAQRVIDRIKKGCQESQFGPIPPNISLGFAVKTDINQDIDSLFTSAENEMYQKKELFKKSSI